MIVMGWEDIDRLEVEKKETVDVVVLLGGTVVNIMRRETVFLDGKNKGHLTDGTYVTYDGRRWVRKLRMVGTNHER